MMTGSRHTYAIRLSVEGGGQVKAELVSVGQSGEQSLKRIDMASPGASACGVRSDGGRRVGGAGPDNI